MIRQFIDWLISWFRDPHNCELCGRLSFRRFRDKIMYMVDDEGKKKLHEMKICKNCANILDLIKKDKVR